MTYQLGRHSQKELEGVHPDLVAVIELAITFTEQDFTVHDGLRTMAEQREYVARGVSRTLRSQHLRQKSDNMGHAADCVPYINGKLRWELAACYVIASAMQRAARELGVGIRWGGSWERLDTDDRSPEQMVHDYIDRRRARGKRPFVDAPHYELAA